MAWFLILDYVLCPVASVVMMLVLILLYRRKQASRNRNQFFVLIGLCHTESAFAICSIFSMFQLLPHRIAIILEIYLQILYYSFMILLTSDRFLVFYLSMKYPIFCTPKRLLKIIFSVVAFPMILVLILVIVIQFELINLSNIGIIVQYVYIPVDTFYIVIVIITYTYIFVKFRRQKKLRSNMLFTKRRKQTHFNLKLPTLIIATFILFNVCPNFLVIFTLKNPQDSFSIEPELLHVMYVLGWIADPLIYVCTLRTLTSPKSFIGMLENVVKFPTKLTMKIPERHS